MTDRLAQLADCPRCQGNGGEKPWRFGTGCPSCGGKGFTPVEGNSTDRLPCPGEIWTNKRNKVRIVTLAQENSSGWEVVVYSYGMGIPSYTDLDDFLERFTRVLEAPTDTKDDNE